MSKAEKLVQHLPFETWEEGETQIIKPNSDIEFNPFTEQYVDQTGSVVFFDELYKQRANISEEEYKKMKRANRKKTAAGEEAEKLFLELKQTLDPNKKSTGSDPDAFQENENEIIKSESPIEYRGNFIYFIDSEKETRLSNFSLIPLYTINGEDETTLYYMRIQNGRSSKTVTIDGDTLSNNRLFKSFCRSKGNFNWLGNQKQLDLLNDYLISEFNCPEVHESNYMGFQIDLESYHPDDPENMKENVWLFPTHAFYNGELLYPDEDGIFHTPNKNYMLNRNYFANFNMSVSPIQKTPSSKEVLDVLSNLQNLYGEYFALGVGFITSSLQVSAITKHTKQFPYFYPTGVRHTGKTDYLNFIYKFAGINADLNVPPERLDVFRKHLGYYSHLPYGYDEAQDENKNNFKATSFFDRFKGELKTLFNRKEIQRGDKDPNKIHRFPIRTCLTFSGEVPTTESAIRSRTVFVQSSKFHHDMDSYDEIIENEEVIHWLGQYMMRTAHEWRAELIQYYEEYLNMMKEDVLFKPILTRVKKNYAILLAGAKVFMKRIDSRFNLSCYTPSYMGSIFKFAYDEMVESQDAVEESQNCVTFLSQVAHLANKGMLMKDVHYRIEYDENRDPKTLFLAHGEAWNALQDARLNTTYNATNQISSELEQFSYFIKPKNKHFQKKINGKNYRVWAFDLRDKQTPEFFQHFAEPQYLLDEERESSRGSYY